MQAPSPYSHSLLAEARIVSRFPFLWQNGLTVSMPTKRPVLHIRNLLVLGICAVALSALPATVCAQSASATPASTELEAILFVQSPQPDNGQGAIHLVWVPQPIQRLCLGKTAQQCSTIDYCVRTTNRDVSMCRNLGIPFSSLPSYPRDMRPRRQLSVTYLSIAPIKSLAMLQDFYHRAPRPSLERLSLDARVKARVRFTRAPEDDDFDVLEILGVAPF
jgi:hypothetical protein